MPVLFMFFGCIHTFRLCGRSYLLLITVCKTSRLTVSIAVDSSLVRCSKNTKNLLDSRRVDWTRLGRWATSPPDPDSRSSRLCWWVRTLTYGCLCLKTTTGCSQEKVSVIKKLLNSHKLWVLTECGVIFTGNQRKRERVVSRLIEKI